VLPKNSTPQLLLVRPAGFEPRLKSSGISLTLSPPEADFGCASTCRLGPNPERAIKKAGCNFFKATPACFFMVRPARFESSKGGFRLRSTCVRPTDSKSGPLSFLTSSNYYKRLNLLHMIFHTFSDFFQF
jgi:hypothetical protein